MFNCASSVIDTARRRFYPLDGVKTKATGHERSRGRLNKLKQCTQTYQQARVHAICKATTETTFSIKRTPFCKLLDMRVRVYHLDCRLSRGNRSGLIILGNSIVNLLLSFFVDAFVIFLF
jgi:hypothetical protein